MSENETEYILKQAELPEWQKWLNQWKHTYNIEVIKMNAIAYPTRTEVVMLIKRTKKST
jgi:hypothetical protein